VRLFGNFVRISRAVLRIVRRVCTWQEDVFTPIIFLLGLTGAGLVIG